MDKNRKIILIYYIICIAIILLGAFTLRFKIKVKINNKFINKQISALNLTKEEKIADFEEFYNNIIESMPLLTEQKNLYGIDFKNRKDYYLELIENTQSEFEFLCTLLAIEEDIPSKHTDICLPIYSNVSNLNCYNAEKINSNRNFKPLIEYWYKLVGNACEQFKDVQSVNFKYIEGKYLFDPMDSGLDYQHLKGFQIHSINNEPMSEYSINNSSTYNIRYDYLRGVPYREYVTLNDSVGKKVTAKLINPDDGRTINAELYFDTQIEVVNSVAYLYKEDNEETGIGNSIYSHSDYKNNIGYVGIKDFKNPQGEKLESILRNMKEMDSIIIDLRDNYGGLREYSINHLYAPLYSHSVTAKLNWFVPYSESNKVINNDLRNKLFYQGKKDDKGIYYTREYKYSGKGAETKQSIYYLINSRAASAADGYAALVKENKLGTIIGTNTFGEGIADSFCCNSLKNSGLVYIYYPSLTYNKDGTNNALYGTSPNIYSEQTKDSFYKERAMKKKQIDINLYPEKIKYDTTLIKAIEVIKQGNQ